MRHIYTFTPDERRVVLQAYQKYTQVLRVIGDLHELSGEITVAQDLSGFVGPDLPAVPGNSYRVEQPEGGVTMDSNNRG